MREGEIRVIAGTRGFLSRFAKDVRANTVAMMAAALIPLAGMVGGGIDISRIYIVKTRLQHACDAGALAGRKAMGGGTWTAATSTTAQQFFDGNTKQDLFGATDVTKTFTESAGRVHGTASATVPMSLMKIFGFTSKALTVTCDADMRLPNTDVMFVLDVTGSMGDTPWGDTQTKLRSLRGAVKCFYEIVARLDTDEVCTTGTPSGGTGSQTQVRFGFVPYSVNVNVGHLLPTAYFANNWTYQSREAVFTPTTQMEWTQGEVQAVGTPQVTNEDPNSWQTQWSGTGASTAAGATSQSACDALTDPVNDTYTLTGTESAPYNQQDSGGNPRTVTWNTKQSGWYYQYRYRWNTQGQDHCEFQRRSVDYDLVRKYTRTDTGTQVTINVFSGYHYAALNKDISGLKNGTLWNASFELPIGTAGAPKTITWNGCIEERATVRQASYSPIPSGAKDLDIDLVPSQSDPSSLWGPALPGVIYTRNGNVGNWTLAESTTTNEYGNRSGYVCPTEARKLQAWTNPTAFDDYVDSLTANGNTYHDIGLLWGARLMSPTGIFASENATAANGGNIERHMIFMTDGDPCTSVSNYQAYGIAWFDRRQTDPNSVPSDGCTTTGTLTQQVNARTSALCEAIKAKNITLWVITFGSVDANTVTRLTACASAGRYFSANNAAQLQQTFKSIADQISQLRLTS